MRYFFIFFVCICIVHVAYAQEPTFSVQGRLVDNADGSGLPGATVLFINVKDSALSRVGATNELGAFKVDNLEKAFYRLNLSSMGYKPSTRIIRLTGALDLGAIGIEADTKVLDNIEVIGEVVPMEKKGDTLLYNADAFKVNPDASATDLVRKMPGIVVDNSGVTANGEQIEQVLMDGKRFFGQDPLLSLNTIPAEVVNKVEVFDQLSERCAVYRFQ
jgi:hypothetical protein